MTTHTKEGTASQAASSIAQDDEFKRLLGNWLSDVEYYQDEENALVCKGWDAFIAHIDAKLAQEREDRDFAIKVMAENMAAIGEVLGVDEDEGGPTAILEAIERLHAGWAEQIGKTRNAESRATAAEAKLEAIRQGVEGLIGRPDNWIKRDEVLALSQPQSNESGLPG